MVIDVGRFRPRLVIQDRTHTDFASAANDGFVRIARRNNFWDVGVGRSSNRGLAERGT